MIQNKMFAVQYRNFDFNNITGHNATMIFPANCRSEAKSFAAQHQGVIKIKSGRSTRPDHQHKKII